MSSHFEKKDWEEETIMFMFVIQLFDNHEVLNETIIVQTELLLFHTCTVGNSPARATRENVTRGYF